MLKDRTNNQNFSHQQKQQAQKQQLVAAKLNNSANTQLSGLPNSGLQQMIMMPPAPAPPPSELVAQECAASKSWSVQASCGAINTTNPIREIIEQMNLAENPSKKVIPLSIGDPTIFGNLKPCNEILDALNNAITSGKFYGYQTASGMESARDAVANYHNKFTGNNVKRQDVILASGCSHAIDLSICVLAKRGQNILIPRPGFPLYKTLTSVYGIYFKQYNLKANNNWAIDLDHLESLIDDETAAIIVNNPSNPCGSVFSRAHLLEILQLAEKHKKPIIADEIYDRFVFNSHLAVNNQRHQEAVIDNAKNSNLLATATKSSLTRSKQQLSYTDPSLVKCPNRRYRYNGDDGPEYQNANFNNAGAVSVAGLEVCDKFDNDVKVKYNQQDDEDEEFVTITTSDDDEQGEPNEIGGGDLYENGNQGGDDDCEKCSADDGNYYQVMADGAGGEVITVTTNVCCRKSSVVVAEYCPFIAMSSLSKTVPILTCGGISKTCLIPGLRLGWIIINDKHGIFDVSVRNGLSRLAQRLMGPNSLVQGALADVLRTVPESFYAKTMQFIYKNARLCYERLSRVRGLQPHMPQGSMYLMVGFNAKLFPAIDGDLNFTSKLMNEQSVLVLPGKCFDFPNYFRICLTVPSVIMEEALSRIKEFCDKYYVPDVSSVVPTTVLAKTKAPFCTETTNTNNNKATLISSYVGCANKIATSRR